MRKILPLIIAVLIAMSSCSKEEKNTPLVPNTPVVVDSNAMQYIINGLTDMSIGWREEQVLPLSFVYMKGDQIPISLSVTGLPEGVSASFSASKGTPSFTSILTLITSVKKDGSYPVSIVARTDKDSVKKFDFTLKIASTDCRDLLTGNFSCKSQCPDVQDHILIEKDESKSNGIIFEEFHFRDVKNGLVILKNVHGSIDCGSKSFDIPRQAYGYFANGTLCVFSATGTYGDGGVANMVIVSYDLFTMEPQTTCSYEMTR